MIVVLFSLLACFSRSPVRNLDQNDVERIAALSRGQYINTLASLDGQGVMSTKNLEISLVGLGSGYMVRGDELVDGSRTSNVPLVASYLNADFEPQDYYNLQGWSKCTDANQQLLGDCLTEANQFVELAFVSFGAQRIHAD